MIEVAATSNKLLASLPADDSRLLAPVLAAVCLRQGETLYEHGDPITHLYFPLGSVVSAELLMADGATVETALVGREGVVGVAYVLGESTARYWNRVLVGGDALRAQAAAVRELCTMSPPLTRAMMRYYRTLIPHVSQRAVCNGRHTIPQRLCTWLLMVHDRAATDELPLTQELIASKLGSRRAGVTEAARQLMREGVLSYSRGKIHVRDRAALEGFACECYRVHHADFMYAETSAAGASLGRA
jgi:CRP-like cAMP-binding protein